MTEPAAPPATVAFKVLTAPEHQELVRTGRFGGSAADRADGFIHLSAAAQVAATIDRHFAGQTGLVVVAVDLAALGGSVRWEPARDGALFPHVYGVLPGEAVLASGPLRRRADGEVELPAARF